MDPVLVEGWFGVPHSYALVLERLVRQWLRDPSKRLYLRPLPFQGLVSGVGDPALRAAIEARRWRGEAVGAVFRLAFPFDISPAPNPGARVVVGMTAEAALPEGSRALPAGADAFRRAVTDGWLVPLAPSTWSAALIRRAGAPRVEVIPYGVDTTIFGPGRRRPRPGDRIPFGPDRFVFLSVGAMTDNKGISSLLAAFAALHRDHPRVALVLKGLDSLYRSTEVVERLLRRAIPAAASNGDEAAALRASIHVDGSDVSDSEMAELYASADAYVAPYLAEGFCLPALEALASGIPVIATAGGPTDEFLPEEMGASVRIRSTKIDTPSGSILRVEVPELVNAMTWAISDAQSCDAAARMGPAFCKAHYDWEVIAERTWALLAGR